MTEKERILKWLEGMEYLLKDYENNRGALQLPGERKRQIMQLRDQGKKQMEISKELGINQFYINAFLRLEERRKKCAEGNRG